MIVLNQKPELVTVEAILDTQAPELVNKQDQKWTLSDRDHKYYMVFNAKTANRRRQLSTALANFAKENKLNVNVNVESFIKIAHDLDPVIVFNLIFETLDFNSTTLYSLKGKAKDTKEVTYNLLADAKFQADFDREMIKTTALNFARTLQDTPPNIATGTYLADLIVKEAKKVPGIKAHVINKAEAEKLGMGLFLGVNAGSPVEAQAVVLEYQGDATLPKTGLVGKGITFDSGGYNLKPSNFMEGMKFDMSGAVIMLSTVIALAKAKAKANVVAIGLFTDNRIGGTATLPESVLKSMNGQTVEINNTDAEGRLVLADGITYVIREKGADRVVEASTLTGAIEVALGPWFTGAFTTNDELFNDFDKASKHTGELVWRLPILPEHLEKMQESKIADLTNSEKGRQAGSSTAAAFLNSFAEEKPYLHLDIASTADDGKRGTGVMVKTLFEWLNK